MNHAPCFDSFPSPPSSPKRPPLAPHRPSIPSEPPINAKGARRTKAQDQTTPADDFLDAIASEISGPPTSATHGESQEKHVKRRRHEQKLPRSGSQSRGRKRLKEKPKATLLDVSQAAAPTLQPSFYPTADRKNPFTVELREDTFNLHHLRPDRAKVPHYRRVGGGTVLGLHPRSRITGESAYRGDGLQISDEGRNKPMSLSHPSVLLLLNDKNMKRISLVQSALPVIVPVDGFDQVSFIPLIGSCNHNEQRGNASSSKPQQTVSAIDIESDSSGEEDTAFQPPEDDGGQSFLDELNARKSELETRARKEPNRVENWLALVRLQDEMKELGLVGLRSRAAEIDQEAARRHVQGTSDIKLSYLKQALRSNPDNEALLLAYMKAFCDQPDVNPTQEWRQVLASNPGITKLWIAFVDWKQSDAGSMNVTEMVEVYEELIDMLVRQAENPRVKTKERCEYEQNLVYLLHRCAVMLQQAGYAERATAVFQAVVEMNFFGPTTCPDSLSDVIDDFESFWDSEAPRVGEYGAKGWLHTSSKDALPLSPPSGLSENFEMTAPWFEQWQTKELEVQLPLRTVAPQSDNDPFGCVLFDDLRNLCFLVTSFDSKQALLYSFLSFIGVTLPPPDVNSNVAFFTDPFLSSTPIDSPHRQQLFWPSHQVTQINSISGAPEKGPGIRSPLTIPFRIFPTGLQQLFARPSHWFMSLDFPPNNLKFVKNAMELLSSTPFLKNDTYFTLCRLSLENIANPLSAVKLAKQMLSLDQANLILWDAYARLCLVRGKDSLAREVYVKALEMLPEGTCGLISLWYSWAEMEFQLGCTTGVIQILARALNCLDSSPSCIAAKLGATASGAVILKARRAFAGQISGLFSREVPDDLLRDRVSTSVAFATFQYVTQGFSAAREVYEETLNAIKELDSPAEEEEIWINYSQLLYSQIEQRRSYKPIEIREILRRAIQTFPNNSIFLSLFAFNESKVKIENQTRRLIDSTLLKDPQRVTAHSWLYAIWVEMHINSYGYNQAAIRNLFEAAVGHDRTKSCPSLWRLYIEFEIRNNQLPRAKSVLLRSHAACPWLKDLYLLPFSDKLKSIYTHNLADLKRMLRLCDEKGIRIKNRLVEEQIQKMEHEMMKEEGEEDLVEALEQKEFEERMKLLPY